MSDWISVDDRLPEPESDEVFIYPRPDLHGTVFTACYCHHKDKGLVWWTDFHNGYDYEDFFPEVTHWMPLPEPPKED